MFRVRTSDADLFGLARLDALFSCFQEAAGHHAQELGVGRAALGAHGCFWVLSRCWMQIGQYPAWGREFVVRTWPQGVHRLFAMRHFRLLDPAGGEFGSGISAWVILDAAKRRPVRPGPFLEHIVMPNEPEVEGGILEKQCSAQEMRQLGVITVPYSDLDVNQHVNNAAYVRWILDSFGQGQHEMEQIRSIRIDYLAETLLGERISIQAQSRCPSGRQTIVGLRTPPAQSVFQAEVAWQHRVC
ncbi:MAG: hypothetical protein EA399_03520 [Desulfovibrionales bacterium]|nr:MAG: hypothetical protein EA399_03520 [Desulfovibrionales bacterium]